MTIAELRRRFALDDPDAITHVAHNGTSAYIGLPEREALKLEDLWQRNEIGLQLSVEVRAPVVVGVYPMHIARFVIDHGSQPFNGNGQPHLNGHLPALAPTEAVGPSVLAPD